MNICTCILYHEVLVYGFFKYIIHNISSPVDRYLFSFSITWWQWVLSFCKKHYFDDSCIEIRASTFKDDWLDAVAR